MGSARTLILTAPFRRENLVAFVHLGGWSLTCVSIGVGLPAVLLFFALSCDLAALVVVLSKVTTRLASLKGSEAGVWVWVICWSCVVSLVRGRQLLAILEGFKNDR